MRTRYSLLAFAPAIFFPLASFVIGLRNPAIFLHILNPHFSIIFSFILAAGGLIFLLKKQNLLDENLHGLILFISFTIGYFLLAGLFNHVGINTNNVYFEADNWSWLRRMAMEDGWEVGTRAAHPFPHLVFRPLISLLSIVLFGNHHEANLLLLSLAGGGCVFLLWRILKLLSMEESSTVLFASLLGLSASHLIFAAVIETYIFSAFCLLLFIWLLLAQKSTTSFIATTCLAFGITITNILQQAVTYLLVRRNFKRTVLVFTIAALIGIGLNILSRFPYPGTEYVFLPQNLMGEQEFQKAVTVQRVELITENLLIYNMAAPQPYTDTRNQSLRFNFLIGTIREYIWFGWPALILWISILALAILHFLKNIRLDSTHTRLSISMLACLLFNFILHAGYGAEPFLYSADWTYALVLFAAISVNVLTQKKWFQIFLFTLVCSVFMNNMWFLYLIARKTAEYLG